MNKESELLEKVAASAGSMEGAQQTLTMMGINTYGIEYVAITEAGEELTYLNRGDTYTPTICREGNGPFFVSSWGDWYEAMEQEHCKNEDVIRCACCGDFTPVNKQDWYLTRCESCGNLVDGS